MNIFSIFYIVAFSLLLFCMAYPSGYSSSRSDSKVQKGAPHLSEANAFSKILSFAHDLREEFHSSGNTFKHFQKDKQDSRFFEDDTRSSLGAS